MSKSSLKQITNLKEAITKLEDSKFDLQTIYQIKNKLKAKFHNINKLKKELKYVNSHLIKLEKDFGNIPSNKKIEITIDNGFIKINEN